jgi:uncharacterized membrane protein
MTANPGQGDSSVSGQQHTPCQLNSRSAPTEAVKTIFIVYRTVPIGVFAGLSVLVVLAILL